MMKIEIGPIHSLLHRMPGDVVDIIREECSYQMDNWMYARAKMIEKAQASGNNKELDYALSWDGRINLMYGKTQFPTGLVPKVIDRLQAEGHKLTIIDNRVAIKKRSSIGYTTALEVRPYQQLAMEAAYKGERGIIKMPTGAGKTVVGSMLIGRLNTPTLILVTKKILIDQWYNELHKFLKLPNVTKDGSKLECVGKVQGRTNEPSFITIAMIPTLQSWMKRDPSKIAELMGIHPEGWGMKIFDECHRLGAEKTYNVMMRIPTYYSIGFSATPLDRTDANLRVTAATGPVLYNTEPESLINTGHLAKPKIKFIQTDRLYFDHWEEYREVYKQGIVFNVQRNKMIADVAIRAAKDDKHVLVFVDMIDHGAMLYAEMLNESKGKKTPMKSTCFADFGLISFVHGTHKDREQIFQGFKDGQIRVLIATEGLIGEGFDYKGINVVIVGDGGKSSIQAIQKIGRGMRVLPGKTEVQIYDFADRCKYLSDHSMQRSTIWMNLGYDVDLTDVPYLEMRV